MFFVLEEQTCPRGWPLPRGSRCSVYVNSRVPPDVLFSTTAEEAERWEATQKGGEMRGAEKRELTVSKALDSGVFLLNV